MGVLEEGLMASLKEQYMSQEDRKKTEKSEWKKEIKDLLSKNETLTKFLEINHIKGEFIKECANVDGYRKERVRDALKNKYLCITPINRALNWCDTSKGGNYWSELDGKYSRFKDEK